MEFTNVFTSPLQRAARTCELSGFGAGAEVDRDLVEWDYGKHEGLTSAQILRERPDWELLRDGAREASRRSRLASERTASSNVSETLGETCCSLPAGISFAC
jgi:probable phosphoglycerate mutase